jgi:TetR/AcrR family transcriptional regulator
MDGREKLLENGLRLFAERGYEAVGVQEIVDAAGVTKPSLYHHFGSKRGLLEAALEGPFGDLAARLEKAATYEGDLPLTLTRIVSACFSFARGNPVFLRTQLAFWFLPPGSEAHGVVEPFLKRLHGRIEAMFAAAAADHGNMRGRGARYAATLLGMINTYIGLSLAGYASLDDDLVVQVVHQFSHGIYS